MSAFRLGTGFTLVKAAPAVILPRMTAGSGTGQSQTSAKYLLLLVLVVLAPVILTWLTSMPGRGEVDFDQLLEAGKTRCNSNCVPKKFAPRLFHRNRIVCPFIT